jgi:hypothetical protein
MLKAIPIREFMPAEVYEGACGHLVILQEWPSIEGEEYVRIILPMSDAENLAHSILSVARGRA